MVCFFFCHKRKSAYELRIIDWSSDVCSSVLVAGRGGGDGFCRVDLVAHRRVACTLVVAAIGAFDSGDRCGRTRAIAARTAGERATRVAVAGDALQPQDRKSVVWGKRGSVRVDLGCRRLLNKNTN